MPGPGPEAWTYPRSRLRPSHNAEVRDKINNTGIGFVEIFTAEIYNNAVDDDVSTVIRLL